MANGMVSAQSGASMGLLREDGMAGVRVSVEDSEVAEIHQQSSSGQRNGGIGSSSHAA